MTDAPAPAKERHALWEELREILRIAMQVFGDPASLLDDVVLPRAEARRLAAWLASLETIARALLAALAATLPQPEPVPSRADRRGSRRPAHNDPITDDLSSDFPPPETPGSERWAGVAFRIAPRTSSGRRGGSPGPAGRRSFLFVRALAYRLEALNRVAADPERFARRLARRLRADPRLLGRALRRPRRRDGHPPPYDDVLDEALALAGAALQASARETG